MIEIQNLTLKFHQKKLLDSISLSIPVGSKLALLGANGAGKSSLLKCLSNQYSDHQGSIRIDQTDFKSWPAQQRAKQMAVMPQSVELAFPFTAQAVVSMGRAPFMDEHKSQNIIESAMEATEVLHLRHRRYPTLSGGEQQRTQLARVLTQIWNPLYDEAGRELNRYLLLDECTAALDPAHQHSIMDLATKFAQQGVTVIAVMHDVNLAASWADEVVLLKDGRCLSSGEVAQLEDANLLAQTYELEPSLAKQYANANAHWRNFMANKSNS